MTSRSHTEKSQYRKRIKELEHRLREPEDKIRQEKQEHSPGWGLIGKWEKEIKGLRKGLDNARRRLGVS